MTRVHGTAVSLRGRGVLILGSSGAGKSGLALQLMAYGADLVSDDAADVRFSEGQLTVHRPEGHLGLVEARGVGLVSVKSIDQSGLEFVVNLDKTVSKRLPEPQTESILGVEVPLICGKNVPNLAAVIWCLLKGGRLLPIE